ncbi:MAG: terminase [Oscillospiraceae bacterium]|nr:terminase [Oscillospiraceae bacterium]
MAVLRNARHERFVQGLIAGLSQRKAYRAAFPGAARWRDRTVDAHACALFSGKVLDRYQEIQMEQKDAALLTRWEKRKILADIARDVDGSSGDRIRAVDTDNRMEREYVDRVEVSRPLDESIRELDDYFGRQTEAGS